MVKEFSKNDIIYLETGQKAVYIEPCTHGHLVSIINDIEEMYDNELGSSIDEINLTIFVSDVYKNFPTQKQHENIAKLENVILDKKLYIRNLNKKIDVAKADLKSYPEKIRKEHDEYVKLANVLELKYPALEGIRNFLDGKFKYVVQTLYRHVRIDKIEEFKGAYGEKIKLIELTAQCSDPEGMSWTAFTSYHSTDIEYRYEVQLATDLETANHIAAKIVSSKLRGHPEWIPEAQRLNVEIPKKRLDHYNEQKQKEKDREHKSIMEDIEKQQKKLADMQEVKKIEKT